MGIVDVVKIAGYAYGAGWRGKDWTVAVAVALAESGGNTNAVGDLALQDAIWGPSIGLWQIRSAKAEKGKGTTRDELANVDPATNAKHAYAIWQGSGWGAWTVHKTGKYLLYMPAATAATGPGQAVDIVGGEGTTGEIADKVASVGDLVGWLGSPGSMTRILKVVVGGALLVAALVVLAKGTITSVIPGGKVVKTVLGKG